MDQHRLSLAQRLVQKPNEFVRLWLARRSVIHDGNVTARKTQRVKPVQ
jgi:hypothetical protein